MAGGVRHAPAPGAARRPARSAEVAVDPRVPRERAGPAGDEAGRPGRRRRAGSRRRSSSTAASSRPTCTWATCARSRATSPGAIAIWERAIDVSPDRAYLALDRLERAYADARAPTSDSPICAAAHRGVAARMARARGAGAAPVRRAASPRRRSSCCSKRSSTTRTRSRFIRRSGTRCRRSTCRGISSRATSRSRASRSSTSTRTCACAAAIAAPSCSGSARTATNGTRSSKSASRRRPTPRPRFPPAWSRAMSRPPAARRAHRRHRHRQVLLPAQVRGARRRRPSTPTCSRTGPSRRARPASTAVVARFGRDVLRSDGELDRARARAHRLRRRAPRRDLEAIIHPAVYAAIDELVRAASRRRGHSPAGHRRHSAALRDRPRRATSTASSSPPAGRSSSWRASWRATG